MPGLRLEVQLQKSPKSTSGSTRLWYSGTSTSPNATSTSPDARTARTISFESGIVTPETGNAAPMPLVPNVN